jgi:hypothetical protein
MQASADRDSPQGRLEDAARTAFELRIHRKLTDAEWANVRTRFLQFAQILRAWEESKPGSR